MDDVASDIPAPENRGVMLIDEFSRVTGLDRRTADALVTDRKVEGMRHADGRVFGIFDDALPTKDELRSLGLDVRDDYDPERHRSYTVVAGDDPGPEGGKNELESGSAGWTMSWGDAES
jgi:hypothetical protein